MINVEVIASGSDGNSVILKSAEATLVIDAGITFNRIQRALDFTNPDAVLITHEHCDHAKPATIRQFLNRGVDVYMTRGTAEALKLEPRYNLKLLIPDTDKAVHVKDCYIWSYSTVHDAAEPVWFDISDGDDIGSDEVYYLTDSGEAETDWITATKLLIEANYDPEALARSGINESLKRRIAANHLSIQQTSDFIRKAESEGLQEVWLMHISKRHGDAARFKAEIESVVGRLVAVYA